MNRDETIARIRTALKKRSSKSWSIKGGRGTAWGWIDIDAPPARCTYAYRLKEGDADAPENYEEYDTGQPGGHMAPADRQLLATLLGLEKVHIQGISIAASSDYYQEYIDRAEGRSPSKIGQRYWD